MLDLLGIGLIAPFIAVVITPETLSEYTLWTSFRSILGITDVHNGLMVLGLIIIFVFCIKGCSAYWVQKKIVKFALDHQSELTCRLMSAYQALPYHFHIKRNTASLIQATSGHTANYSHHTLMASLRLLSEMIVVIMILGLLATTNFIATLTMAFVLASVYLLYDKVVKHRIQIAGQGVAKASEGIIKGVSQGIGGLKEIRVFGRELYFHNKVKDCAVDFADISSQCQALKVIPRYLFESAIITFVVGLSIIAILMKETGANVFPVLGMFGVASIRLIPSANQISGSLTSMRFSSYAMNELYADLNELREIESNPLSLDIQRLKTNHNIVKTDLNFAKIEVKNISYQYPGTEIDAISNMSMCIKHGQSIGLIGKSGSGKTTLVNILLGLLEPQQGAIQVDGVPIRNDLRKWLDIVAYIPQDVFIIDDTIRKNIAFGIDDEDIDEKKVARSIEAAQLKEVVNRLPAGLETYVGERGVRLSGGERQRVALARSFYHEREVIIMDEATAALDDETQKHVVEAIDGFKSRKTMIIIAHRLSTLRDCDVIYKLDSGRIIDSGSLESLGEIHSLI